MNGAEGKAQASIDFSRELAKDTARIFRMLVWAVCRLPARPGSLAELGCGLGVGVARAEGWARERRPHDVRVLS